MWCQGYLEQARSDWDVYNILARASLHDCHILHYIQMTTEKLGKAFLLAGGIDINVVNRSHVAFTRFIRIAARNHNLQKELGMSGQQLRAHFNNLLPIASKIERLAPALARGGPNTEYPWEAPPGNINVPALYEFPVNLRLSSIRHLLKLIKTILDKFYVFFS